MFKGISLNRKKIITEGSELQQQKNKQKTSEWVKEGHNTNIIFTSFLNHIW